MTRSRGNLSFVALFATALVATANSPVASAATGHSFTASYRGTGAGQVSGASASGSATMSGRGRLIGASTLSGEGHGTFTSATCVTFSGAAVIKGDSGSIRLAARNGNACVAADASTASFSGRARVTGGTETFAGARGNVTFSGRYTRQTGMVTLSLRGTLTY